MKQMKWLAGLSFLMVTAVGCGSGDVCLEASEHVAACTSSKAAPVTSCNANQAAAAEELLAMECYEIQLAQSSGKAEFGVVREFQSHDLYGVCDPQESSVCEYCSTLKVDFQFLGITVGSCLYSSTCERVTEGPHEGKNLCNCEFMMGYCGEDIEDDPQVDP